MKPKIRLKGFSGEWEETTFDKSVTINSGMDYKHLAEGNIPVYGTGGYMLSVNESLSDVDAIGIGRKGTIDKPQLLKAPFWTVDTLFFMTPKNGNDLNFLYALSQKINWRKYDESTGVPSLSKLNIGKIEFAKPERKEQHAIASYFQHLDSLIQSTMKKIESLKQVKAASLQSMFPQNGERTPRVRFDEFKGEWANVSLGEETYPAGIKNHDNLPLESYSISNEFGFIPQNVQFENGGTMATADKRMYYIVSKNSFGYNPARINVGSLGYYSGEDDVIVSSLYEIFKTTDRIYDIFLLYWFKTSSFQKLIEQYQEGGVRFYFFYDKLCMCNLLIPSYDEQKKIADYFTNLDTQISLHKQRLEKLKQIKSACLEKMFV